MKRFYSILFAAASLAAPAVAGTVKSDYVGCLTKDALDEFVQAASSSDMRQMNALLQGACAPIGGYEFSIVDRGMLKSKIRVYVGDKSVVLWTVSEAIR